MSEAWLEETTSSARIFRIPLSVGSALKLREAKRTWIKESSFT
jgi:hypothetical protein